MIFVKLEDWVSKAEQIASRATKEEGRTRLTQIKVVVRKSPL